MKQSEAKQVSALARVDALQDKAPRDEAALQIETQHEKLVLADAENDVKVAGARAGKLPAPMLKLVLPDRT